MIGNLFYFPNEIFSMILNQIPTKELFQLLPPNVVWKDEKVRELVKRNLYFPYSWLANKSILYKSVKESGWPFIQELRPVIYGKFCSELKIPFFQGEDAQERSFFALRVARRDATQNPFYILIWMKYAGANIWGAIPPVEQPDFWEGKDKQIGLVDKTIILRMARIFLGLDIYKIV